jgi:hypothetical protein
MAPENTYSRTLAPTYKVGRGATHPKADSAGASFKHRLTRAGHILPQ